MGMSVVDHVYGLRQLAAFHCLEFRPLLDSEASHTADLQCGTVSHQPCANMSLAAFKSKLTSYLFSRSQWFMMVTQCCCGVFFVISAPWYKWLYSECVEAITSRMRSSRLQPNPEKTEEEKTEVLWCATAVTNFLIHCWSAAAPSVR